MALATRAVLVRILPPRPSPTTTRSKQPLKQDLSRRGGASLAVHVKDGGDYGAMLSEKPAPAPAKQDGWEGFGRDVSSVEEEVQSEPASWGVLNQISVVEPPALLPVKRDGWEHFGQDVSSAEEVQREPASHGVLNQSGVELDSDKSYSALAYGTSAGVAIWISSIVVSELDSVPLVPQMMEVVGLGFTIWFTSRYLIFKENRDELITRVTAIKKQILGSHDS